MKTKTGHAEIRVHHERKKNGVAFLYTETASGVQYRLNVILAILKR